MWWNSNNNNNMGGSAVARMLIRMISPNDDVVEKSLSFY